MSTAGKGSSSSR